MKRSLIALAVLSLVSVACAGAPSSDDVAELAPEAGAAGAAGAPGTGGSGGKLTVEHPSGGAPAAAGSSSMAGMPSAGSAGSVATSCSVTDAFALTAAPTGPLTIGAWSDASSSAGLCWKQEAAACSFTVDSWGPSPTNASRYRMLLKNVKCDTVVYFGKGSADACVTEGACDAFDGSNAAVVAIDFDLTASAGGFVASNMEQFASNAGGSSGTKCDITESPASDMLTTATEELLAAMTFSCTK